MRAIYRPGCDGGRADDLDGYREYRVQPVEPEMADRMVEFLRREVGDDHAGVDSILVEVVAKRFDHVLRTGAYDELFPP